jgi:signal transduction histidine kinase
LWVDDDGVGLPNASNLFVPLFTTKPGGSGIGLLLSRQIAEAHGGTLTVENRADNAGAMNGSNAAAANRLGGCRAELRLAL